MFLLFKNRFLRLGNPGLGSEPGSGAGGAPADLAQVRQSLQEISDARSILRQNRSFFFILNFL